MACLANYFNLTNNQLSSVSQLFYYFAQCQSTAMIVGEKHYKFKSAHEFIGKAIDVFSFCLISISSFHFLKIHRTFFLQPDYSTKFKQFKDEKFDVVFVFNKY